MPQLRRTRRGLMVEVGEYRLREAHQDGIRWLRVYVPLPLPWLCPLLRSRGGLEHMQSNYLVLFQ